MLIFGKANLPFKDSYKMQVPVKYKIGTNNFCCCKQNPLTAF